MCWCRLTFADLQGFKTRDGEFIIKEAAVLQHGHRLSHWVFEPPFSAHRLLPEEARQVAWLVKRHHGIAWNEGFVAYDRASTLLKTLLEGESVVYVKGAEKKCWLKTLTSIDCLNVETDLGDELQQVPKLAEMDMHGSYRCAFHKGVCVMENVHKLHNEFCREA